MTHRDRPAARTQRKLGLRNGVLKRGGDFVHGKLESLTETTVIRVTRHIIFMLGIRG